MRRAKIVGTIGPSSREEDVLSKLIEEGLDIARLNFSHGTHEEHGETIRRIRRASALAGREVTILQDLAGPKIRLGELERPVTIAPGDILTLTVEEILGTGLTLPVRYPHFAREVAPGDRFSMNDGLVNLRTLDTDGVRVRAEALSGGVVSTHKGVNLPKGGDGLPSLTQKDADDLRFGLSAGVDWVSLSFVRSPSDADAPRRVMAEAGRAVPLMAKIEKRQALERIDEILARFDGLMVARGDLGVEVDLEDLPAAQKRIIRKANLAAKPVVTATQMLLSMVSSPRPTRAEVTDVANAILDGSDAVMLSEETAMGAYPVEAVRMMAVLADRANGIALAPRDRRFADGSSTSGEAIAHASRLVAAEVGAAAIVIPTASGETARLVAATRPPVPLLALSSSEETLRQLGLVWGVTARRIPPSSSTEEIFLHCRTETLASGIAEAGARVVLTAGVQGEVSGSTNLLRVLEL